MGQWVLDRPEVRDRVRRFHLDPDVQEIVEYLVFASFGRMTLDRTWPHTHLFTELIERWVQVVGPVPEAFRRLVDFLDGPGWVLTPEPALQWLSQCMEASPEPTETIWRSPETALHTARLLQHVLGRGLPDPASFRRLVALVDRLVQAGVPLAGVLRTDLERRR